MKQNKHAKIGWLLAASSLLLFACGNDEASQSENDSTEETAESQDVDEGQANGQDEENGSDEEIEENQTESDQNEKGQQETYELSEIVDMSEEEKEAHHRELAVQEEHLMDEVFENLLLPGIHENTVYYEGRVGPEEQVQLEFPDGDNPADSTTVQPQTAAEGYFSVDLSDYPFSSGEAITVRITGGYPQEQTFEIPVHEAEDGMEEVRVVERPEASDDSEMEVSEIDTLESIAYQYGITVEELEVGTTLNVDGSTDTDSEADESAEANEEDSSESYEDYSNGRFGFSVEYPSTFEADYMPANNDGIEVNDDTATIIASGSHGSTTGEDEGYMTISEAGSIEPFYEGALLEAEEEGDSISYERLEDDWYAISYFDGTNNIYKKSILGDDYIANLHIEYPAELQDEYEEVVERVSDSFQIP
ncbi:hypothetical protein [Oceanobacillus jeddahense]|uniref:hypothetical protein n=1 Tax=Oceanobacillus jeddahense TaxID=1462527 RepID=UPI000595888F|nr:hypothetical protein [Oceanobacillus jeddahense]